MKLLPVRKVPPNSLLQYLPRWQQNNSPTDLGIARFIFDLYYINEQMGYPPLIRDFKIEYGVAPWAADALANAYYYEEGMTKEDRCHAFATYREGSKTFWFSFVSTIYDMLVGQYGIYYHNTLLPEVDYQILRGKNNREAQKRILNIANFLRKPIIREIFGEINPTFKQVKEKEAKDSGGLLILPTGHILECSGIEQPSRGLNLFQVRPKKIVFDDVQNRENTKTDERRKQIDAEVMNESFGAVADNGMMWYIANKVHAADTLGRVLDNKNKAWKKHFYTLTVIKKEDGTILPGVGDLDHEIPEWGKRWTIERCKKLKEWYETQPELGGIKGFLKEYYNRIVSDTDYKILYHSAKYTRLNNINWLEFIKPDGQKEYKNVYIVLGLDPAISEKKSSSDAVISVMAVTSDKKRYVLEQKFGKFSQKDMFDNLMLKPLRGFALTPQELSAVKRIGSSHECIRLALKYHADAVNIEVAGQQMTFFLEFQEAAQIVGWSGVMRPEPAPSEGKVEKLSQVPLTYFESNLYYIREDMIELKNDVIAFPDCRKDRLDSLYLCEQVIQFPADISYNPLGQFPRNKEFQPSSEPTAKKTSLLNDHEGWITV